MTLYPVIKKESKDVGFNLNRAFRGCFSIDRVIELGHVVSTFPNCPENTL